MSSQAWGKEEKRGTQFALANWELGVVFPPEKGSSERKKAIVESLNVKFPPDKYHGGDLPYFGD